MLGIVPARFASTRFPGKPLALIDGKPMVQWVYEGALNSNLFDQVVVATESDEIVQVVEDFGGKAILTSDSHINGTSRCHEVVQKLGYSGPVVNIQGDEPFVATSHLQAIVDLLKQGKSVATLVKKLTDSSSIFNPNVVKAVVGVDGKAMYFSRSPIPHFRGLPEADWILQADYYKHLGIYGYQSETLAQLVELKAGRLELIEQLEQLRWLENGVDIYTSITEIESLAVDTPEDLEKVRAVAENRK